MITKACYTERPNGIKYMLLPSGEADVWIRNNISEIIDPETDNISYEADEAYMRTSVAEDDISSDFDTWFETASAWQPFISKSEPDTQERHIEALTEELKALKIILGVE